MIVYHEIMEKLSQAGYTAYKIQQLKLLPNSTMDRIRHNAPITTTTIDTLCRLCQCQPGDLITWQPDPEE